MRDGRQALGYLTEITTWKKSEGISYYSNAAAIPKRRTPFRQPLQTVNLDAKTLMNMGQLFKLTVGVEIVHVPFKGVAQAVPEIMSGRLQLAFNTIPAFLPHVKAGRLKAFVITAPKRSPLLPQVPACNEAGLPGLEASAWHAVVAPARTPKAVVDRLQETLAKTLADPEVKNQLAAVGAEPVASTPAEFAKFMRAEFEKWARVIKAGGVRVE